MSNDVGTVIRERRSIRSYKDEQVPDDLLREILAEARWAPSARNTQSTYVYALSGEPLKAFKAQLRQYAESEVDPHPDFPPTRVMPEKLAARQQELAQARTAFVAEEESRLGIKQPDPPVSPLVAGSAIFGAPTVLVLAFDEGFSDLHGCFDGGLFTMAIALAARARGLDTCITTSNVRYPELLRAIIPGAEKQKMLAAVAIGWAQPEAPVNRFPRTRIATDEFLRFVR